MPDITDNGINNNTESISSDATIINCEICDDVLDDPNYNYMPYEGGSVCPNCADHIYTCNCCSDTFHYNSSISDLDTRDGVVCQDCYDNRYYGCDDCGDRTHEDDLCSYEDSESNYCPDCYRANDNRNSNNSSVTVHQSSEHGEYIKSTRYFGIELEVIQDSDLNRNSLPIGTNLVSDGSLSNGCIEVVSPILQGKKGEDYIKELCEQLSMYGTKVDKSCGFHVHYSADDYRNNVENLKKLLAFYIVYDDIILSMLPPSRRRNTFCHRIKDEFALGDISRAYGLAELERLWYKVTRNSIVDDKKGDHYDSSRYRGLNLHSLFNKDKTIEVRYHSGTVNYNKVIKWVSLHQSIMDCVANSLSYQDILADNEILNYTDKLNSFSKRLNLSKDIIKYIKNRAKTFGTKLEDSEIVGENAILPTAYEAITNIRNSVRETRAIDLRRKLVENITNYKSWFTITKEQDRRNYILYTVTEITRDFDFVRHEFKVERAVFNSFPTMSKIFIVGKLKMIDGKGGETITTKDLDEYLDRVKSYIANDPRKTITRSQIDTALDEMGLNQIPRDTYNSIFRPNTMNWRMAYPAFEDNTNEGDIVETDTMLDGIVSIDQIIENDITNNNN